MAPQRYSAINHNSEKAFIIAMELVAKCEKFFTELAYQNGNLEMMAEDLGENLFIVDHHIRHAMNANQLSPAEYEMLSDSAELITDCVYSLQHRIHPWVCQRDIRSADVKRFPPSLWPNRVFRKIFRPFQHLPGPMDLIGRFSSRSSESSSSDED